MNALPVVGCVVEGVVPGYSLQIHLSEESIIQLEQPFRYTTNQGETTLVDPLEGKPDISSVRLEGVVISAAEYSDSGMLSLLFSNGHSIVLAPDNSRFEAWHVTTPREVIVGTSGE